MVSLHILEIHLINATATSFTNSFTELIKATGKLLARVELDLIERHVKFYTVVAGLDRG